MAASAQSISWRVGRDLAAAQEQVFEEHSIDLVHQLQRLGIYTDWRAIQPRSADLQRLALLGQAQACAIPIDRRLASGWVHHVSPCDKKSF